MESVKPLVNLNKYDFYEEFNNPKALAEILEENLDEQNLTQKQKSKKLLIKYNAYKHVFLGNGANNGVKKIEEPEFEEKTKEIQEEVIKLYKRCINWNVKHYKWCDLSRDDIIQEGAWGIIKALDSYEHNHKNKVSKKRKNSEASFFSCVGYWIQTKILKAIYKGDLIWIPIGTRKRLLEVKEFEKLVRLDYKEPTLEELADTIKVTKKRLKDILLTADKEIISLDKAFMHGYDLTDMISDEKNNKYSVVMGMIKDEQLECLDYFYCTNNKMNFQKALAVYHYYFEGRTLQEIGDEILNMSRERVRQLKVLGVKDIKRELSERFRLLQA